MEKLLSKIFREIEKGDLRAYEDLYYVCVDKMDEDTSLCISYLKRLSDRLYSEIPKMGQVEDMRRLYELHRNVLRAAAPYDFDSYMLFVEWNRDMDKRFYVPRRKQLKVLVDDLQDLADGKLEFLGISLPPRVGKSTLCIFFMTWIMGRHPESANVMSGHSDKLTDGFYKEILSIIGDRQEYLWHEAFPGVNIADQSAKNETIDLGKRKRFPTVTCRSISGTLTGAVEVGSNGILYCDDLIEDLEESLNPVRLQNKYDAYLNQLKDRKKLGAKELMIGTRWNVADPLGRVQMQYAGNDKYRFRVISAVDDEGHSNFNYLYGVGFDDHYYQDMKESIDPATWAAKYMGHPYVREGLLFPQEELKTYNGVLPDGDAMKLAVCDVAWGGGDSLSMVLASVIGDEVYVEDVVFNNRDKNITYPEVVGKLKAFVPCKARFEANNGGSEYAAEVDRRLREAGVRINVSSKRSSNTAKLARIIQYSPDIKRFYFLDEEHRSGEYRKFMQEVTTYTQMGKNPHDDAPDSLAMLADEIAHGRAVVSIFQRPW